MLFRSDKTSILLSTFLNNEPCSLQQSQPFLLFDLFRIFINQTFFVVICVSFLICLISVSLLDFIILVPNFLSKFFVFCVVFCSPVLLRFEMFPLFCLQLGFLHLLDHLESLLDLLSILFLQIDNSVHIYALLVIPFGPLLLLSFSFSQFLLNLVFFHIFVRSVVL